MTILLEIIYNLGMLTAVSIISGFIGHVGNHSRRESLQQGLLFGTASVLGMLHPLVLAPGLIFDGRSIMISIAGLFFGPAAALTAAAMAIAYRVSQGGPGAVMGVLVILASAGVGLAFHTRWRDEEQPVPMKALYAMGVIVHAAMVLLMLTLPAGQRLQTIRTMGFPVLAAYPLATLLIGGVLSGVRRRRKLTGDLSRSQEALQTAYGQLEASYNALNVKEAESQEQLQRLAESEERFRAIVELAPLGIHISTIRTCTITRANQRFAEIVGRTVEEVTGLDWRLITHPEDLARNAELNQRLLSGETRTFELDKRYLKPDGEVVWVNIRIVALSGAEGRETEICFVEDVTEKKRALEALAASEKNFRSIFEGTSDAALLFRDYLIADCNRAAAELLGDGTKASVIGRTVLEFSPELQPDGTSSADRLLQVFRECVAEGKTRLAWCHEKPGGGVLSVDVVLTALVMHGETMIHALVRDVTEQKALEQQLEHMSYHDQLTGIYNRRFYEEELQRLDVPRNLPLTVVMGDVNGLKLVNDSFGHAMGDRLLVRAAELIRQGCRHDEIIARIGGDEFMLLLPGTDSEEAGRIAARVRQRASESTLEGLDISISFGWATKQNPEEAIGKVLQRAEDNLYKQKLFESPSVRGRTIQTIIRTLYEKNRREEEHSRRVSEISQAICRVLEMPEEAILEIRNVGLLHDIGKIAIDEQLLNHPGRLSDEDWRQMKKHPEIGYRILSTVNDMAEIAEYVLAHHERWDGGGYPRGLAGEAIPLQARIIAIADAYDAMTSDRTYRRAMTREAALREIVRCGGTQFDPRLTEVFTRAWSTAEGAL